jgi:hypothetical protein
VLDAHDRVVILDGREEEAFRVVGEAGMTTFKPGMWAKNVSRLWECWAASPVPAPPWVRMTRGIFAFPPVMYLNFAAWFTIWSIAIVAKSTYMISTTGLIPRIAAPTPDPIIATSDIGLDRTLFFPNFSMSP